MGVCDANLLLVPLVTGVSQVVARASAELTNLHGTCRLAFLGSWES